jgi:hypothetical protein
VGDFTGESESALGIAERAGIALNKDAMENRFLGIVD